MFGFWVLLIKEGSRQTKTPNQQSVLGGTAFPIEGGV